MRVAITDSGVGGLSVCAALEAALARRPPSDDLEVLYLNAALEDDYAYNSMATRREQLLTFDAFLDGATRHYAPDLMFIACNTLSVLFEDPHYARHDRFPILGIVDTGVAELLAALDREPDTGVIVFATPITVAGNTYRDRLVAAGVAPERIVQQACPGLPDAISNDVTGAQAAALLDTFVPAALDAFAHRPSRVLAFLGCTHFGYQADRFRARLEAGGVDATVIDPNIAAANTLLAAMGGGGVNPGAGIAPGADPGADPSTHADIGTNTNIRPGQPSFGVVSRYSIPERPLRSLAAYLGDRAPATLAALRGQRLHPDLFGRIPQEESA